MKVSYLQKAADVVFVVRAHEHYILKHPEERSGVIFLGFEQVKDAVKVKEQPASALCGGEENYTNRRLTLVPIWRLIHNGLKKGDQCAFLLLWLF